MTAHSSGPSKDGTATAGPVTAGWLLQVTPSSLQPEAICSASSVRPSLADDASRRSTAEAMPVQPAGKAGSGKRTSARES